MGVGEALGAAALVIAACVVGLWLLSLALRDASIVDIFWGPGFAIVAGTTFVLSGADSPRRALIAIATIVWGIRLGGYLLWRNAGAGEDPRYVAMRRRWGARFPLASLVTVFALQGTLIWIVSLPVQVVQAQPGGALGALDVCGLALWAFGLFFETTGDIQLARFRADPANADQVLDRGLWRYTRHPNYFGDCCVWWGLFLIALASPYGYWTVIGPVVMTFFLLRVSGVALLERSIHKRRPAYADYQRRTSAFIPRPPRA